MAERKAGIVWRRLLGQVPASDLADELRAQPAQIHDWIKPAQDQAKAAFAHDNDEIEALEGLQGPKYVEMESQVAERDVNLTHMDDVTSEPKQ